MKKITGLVNSITVMFRARIRAYLLLMMVNAGLSGHAQPTLLPQPQHVIFGNGRLELAGTILLVPAELSAGARHSILAFQEWIWAEKGIKLDTASRAETHAATQIHFKVDHRSGPLALPGDSAGPASKEWYSVIITGYDVSVTARSDAGLFYALQTMRQLITKDGNSGYLPEVTLEDYPSFAFRGIMMDLAHGGLLTVEEIKRQIDFLSKFKINQYYFYNEVSIELKGYSLINYKGRYTQEQVKQIVAYGQERYIDVIPFVNFYGHLHEFLRFQKYTNLGIGTYGHDLDPRKPEVQVLLRDWISQYGNMFPSPFIHVGFDETWETERLSKTVPLIKPDKLYIDHLGFITRTLQAGGKTVMVWTDISKNYPGIIAQFPKSVVPVVWDYGSDTISVNRWIKPIVADQRQFMIQSGVDGWAHLYPTETTWDNIDICLRAATKNRAIGYITSVWTDAIQPLLRNSWMFMGYGAVVSWQGNAIERNKFIGQYAQVIYPSIDTALANAFTKLAESQVYLRKCLGQTQTRMWINPFLPYNLKLIRDHRTDFQQARLAAELAEEFLLSPSVMQSPDSAFGKTMLLNARLLSYTAMRFLWAARIVERFEESMRGNDDSWFPDVAETPHGMLMDLLDYTTELKQEYTAAWLSENMPYRLANISARFDDEYRLWKSLSSQVRDFQDHGPANRNRLKFRDVFKIH